MESFNLDMIMEILSYSSLQTMSKCRILSKESNTLTYESLFRDLHSQRTKIVSGLFIHDKFYSQFVSTNEQPALSLDFLPSQVRIKASTNAGILLCANDAIIPEYYVCKPTTKQYKKLPNPKTRFSTLATGMLVVKSNPLCYKIVRISEPKIKEWVYWNKRTEIFDSETWSWKQVNGVSLYYTFRVGEAAISAGGSLYWRTTDDKTIVAYHQEDNCCSKFTLPEEIHESRHIKLVEYEGRLAVVCDKGGLIELWMMRNNIGEKAWSKRFCMSFEDMIERWGRCSSYFGSDVALFVSYYKLRFYNMKKKTTDVVRVRTASWNDLFQLQSDYQLVYFYSRRKAKKVA